MTFEGTELPSYQLTDGMEEVPCKCGFTPTQNKDEFEIFDLRMGWIMDYELPPRKSVRCKTCKKPSIIKIKTNPCMEILHRPDGTYDYPPLNPQRKSNDTKIQNL